MASDLDVGVDMHPPQCPRSVFLGRVGERSPPGALALLAHAVPAPGQCLAGPLLALDPSGCDGGVHLGERAACLGAEPGQHPACDDVDAPRNVGVVSGPSSAGGDAGHARVLGEIGVGALAGRRVAMGVADSRLEGIGPQDLGDATKGVEGAHVGGEPVWHALAPGGFGTGRGGGPKDGDAEGSVMGLAGVRVHHRHALPGGVHTEGFAGPVVWAHAHLEPSCPLAIRRTAGAVREALRGDRLVCLPPQAQGNALAFEGPLPRGPVGHGSLCRGPFFRGGSGTESSLQGRIISGCRQRPGPPGDRGPLQRLGHGWAAAP